MLYRRSRIRRHRWLTLTVFLLGCGSLVEPPLPPNTVPMTAPAVYSVWWDMVEACSGIMQPMSAVRWYRVQGVSEFRDYTGRDLAGYWSSGSNEIVLADSVALDGAVVRHEMLHAITRLPGHPRDEFLNKCGGVVDCADGCVADAGPIPRFAGRVLPSDSIELTFAISPQSPSASIDDGTFMIKLWATNPTADSISVDLEPGRVSGNSFSYFLTGTSGGAGLSASLVDSSLVRFAPHETKQYIFDFQIGVDRQISPGTYSLSVGYGRKMLKAMLEIRQ